jgi:Ca-activated chloride channel family protein
MKVKTLFIITGLVLLLYSFNTVPDLLALMRDWERTADKNAFAKPVSRPGAQARFHANVNLVLVRASVTDRLDRFVAGLGREQFRLFEDKVEQTIAHFDQDDAAVSLGIIFDISGSMKKHFASAKASLLRCLARTTSSDEFFLVTFNHKVTLETDFTNKSSDVQNTVALRAPGGRTALYDAVYLSLEKVREGRNSRKALIIVTDGEDNSSRYSFFEVKEAVKESDVQLYAIGVLGELQYGRIILQDLVKLTGGRAFFPYSLDQLDYYIHLIHDELRHQYVIGYYPTNRASDGRWRKIRVTLNGIDGPLKLAVRARTGYYVSRE